MYSLNWSYAYGKPESTALFKFKPEDFQVTEIYAGEFSGEGEHILIKIEKHGLTTEEVVKSLSRLINKPVKAISYAGLKDRQAVAIQWLSIHAPGEVISGIETLQDSGWKILALTRHNKKLKPGFLAGNHFKIKLRNLTNETLFRQRIEQIKLTGVPNYFGEQRFGRDGGNVAKAHAMLIEGRKVKDRFLKGMYYSAARSWLYNLILSRRVSQNNWNVPINGDVMQLSGSNSIFTIENVEENIIKRVQEKDLSPASPLPGKTKNKVKHDALILINDVYKEWQPWLTSLAEHGLEEAWRANILSLQNLEYSFLNNSAELSFTLPAGSYATAVLRELVQY
ncbi:hydrogenase [Legionella beliardensis]|uniref:tRNA pseudouridine synthase D n=1 Tax=Legionella beliardensis TaxID=91822 RepID=A0A378I544_9GAMM|nr:tRNA pseudouridine(13) synthase TruD [Legionella beliardensis]STX29962.1 hydrogenase [Legionella beliardensis]